jgi:hypothetical protein
MDGSIETLLILLITLLSVLAIAGLVLLIVALVALNKLIKKIQLASDMAVGTVQAFRSKYVKSFGLFGATRYVYKLVKRK